MQRGKKIRRTGRLVGNTEVRVSPVRGHCRNLWRRLRCPTRARILPLRFGNSAKNLWAAAATE